MNSVVVWGYQVTFADIMSFGALVASLGAVVVSIFASRFNRNSLSLYEGSDYEGVKLYITNNSPHAVTVSDIGYVGPDGCSSSLLTEWGLKRRIDPRDEAALALNDDMTYNVRKAKGKYKRYCLYVTLATGHRFYSVSRKRIVTWWVVGWLDGSRRR